MMVMLDTCVLISAVLGKKTNAWIHNVNEKHTIVLCTYVVDEDIQEDDEWTNKTRLTGNYTDINGNLTELVDEDEHTAITYKEKLKITILPRTGTDISTNTIVIRVINRL